MMLNRVHRASSVRGTPALTRPRCLVVSRSSNWFGAFVNGSKPKPKEAVEVEPTKSETTAETEVVHAPSGRLMPPRNRDFLEAKQVSLYQMFDSDEMRFDIPVYQRAYSWDTKQIFDMVSDFHKAYVSRSEYFLGAIVTVRASGSTALPSYEIIDGQQRLTSLFILLAALHDWAKEEGNDVLQQRLWRMMHLDRDPLDESSVSRFRLVLREADDKFFRDNVMSSFLPQPFFFDGVSSQKGVVAEAGPGQGPLSPTPPTDQAASCPLPVECEAHWRLYRNATFLKAHLRRLVAEQNVNLSDFMFHCLRSCYLVVMTARDEASSFSIFSTLNSRGVDLTEVDKLKADLFKALEVNERIQASQSWAEMENLLGRSQFHATFRYMKDLAMVLEPQVSNLSVLEYFSGQLSPSTVSQVINVALDYARILLQLRKGRFAAPEGGDLSDPSTLAALTEQCKFMNLFDADDDAWLPVTLEFFLQVEDPALRLRFLKAAETLQLFLGLQGDAAVKQYRWNEATKALLARPLNVEAVLSSVTLSPEDRHLFLTRLDSKDLAATVDQKTLVHLLLRAETNPQAVTSKLLVERIVPQHLPVGSAWRKTKISSGSDDHEASRYWYEVQRLFWSGKLGNLILLPMEQEGASSVAMSDYDQKAAFYRDSGAAAMFPVFTGQVAEEGGRYAKTKFSFDECQQRQVDLVERLASIYLN